MNEKQTCCICGKEYAGHGNNAEPVADGRCCDSCNASVVVPQRINMIRSANDTETQTRQ